MRIDAYNQINSIYQTNKVLKTEKSGKLNSAADAVQISSVGQDYQIAKKAISEVGDVREDVVDSIKQKIKSGDYDISTEAIADKLLERLKEMR